MGRVEQTGEAKSDLAHIWHYIALDSVGAADRLVARIDAVAHRLADMPGLGPLRTELAANLRSFPLGRYIIFYRPIPEGIEIIRVLHGARDIASIFHPPEAQP